MTHEQYQKIKGLITLGENSSFFNAATLNTGIEPYSYDFIDSIEWQGKHTAWNFAQVIVAIDSRIIDRISAIL